MESSMNRLEDTGTRILGSDSDMGLVPGLDTSRHVIEERPVVVPGDRSISADLTRWVTISETLLDRLQGRMSLVQPAEDRQRVVADVLDGLCSGPEGDVHPLLSGLCSTPEGDSRSLLATQEARRAFLQSFLSYDLIEEFLQDQTVEDIMINATEPILVHKAGQGLVKTEKRFTSARELALFVKKLIVFSGCTECSEREPIHDVELANIRGRVNIILSPFGPQITITRAKKDPLSILHLIESGAMTYELAAQLWMYVEGLGVRPANILIAGGPGAGKTTLLNALMSFIPRTERVVTLEDTFELNTNVLDNCSRLESTRHVSMATLVKNALRMRPDRIVVGEVRGEEARDLMTAVNVGKYTMGTLHASTARETIMRLENEPMRVPGTLVNLVDVFVVLRRLNVHGTVSRRVVEVAETAGMEKQIVLLSTNWSYDAERGHIVESSPSTVYRDRLAQEAGVTSASIMAETARRAAFLKLLHDRKDLTDIKSVTRMCRLYITNPEQAAAQLA